MDNGDTRYRNMLLKRMMELKMSSGEMHKETVALRDKTNEEKERLAKEILERLGYPEDADV